MSVSFARAYAAEMRQLGFRVDLLSGYESCGNGQTSDYEGSLTHHTAAPFDGGFSVLVNGRSDLDGPLCNVCTWSDGHQTLIAAHPANHAGASGGYNTSPLPVTSLFNKRVWGNEIMYPGTVYMTGAQYRTSLAGAGVVCKLLGKPFSYAKFHAETSVTGKWDPGYAPGKTYNASGFRASIPGALKEEDVPLTAADVDKVWEDKDAYGVTARDRLALISNRLTDVEGQLRNTDAKLEAILSAVKEGQA